MNPSIIGTNGGKSAWECRPGDDNDVSDARKLIRSDPLKNEIDANTRIGLFDSGVDQNAIQVQTHSQDCRQGSNLDASSPFCNGGQAGDTNSEGHGTKSASILASGAQEPYAGVTSLPLHSFKIGERMHSEKAVQRAMGVVNSSDVANRPRVLLVQVQATGSDRGIIAAAANVAFEQGQVVVAPSATREMGRRYRAPETHVRCWESGVCRYGISASSPVAMDQPETAVPNPTSWAPLFPRPSPEQVCVVFTPTPAVPRLILLEVWLC